MKLCVVLCIILVYCILCIHPSTHDTAHNAPILCVKSHVTTSFLMILMFNAKLYHMSQCEKWIHFIEIRFTVNLQCGDSLFCLF
jgi:hypothetical protein